MDLVVDGKERQRWRRVAELVLVRYEDGGHGEGERRAHSHLCGRRIRASAAAGATASGRKGGRERARVVVL